MVKSERADLMPVTEEVIAGLTRRLIVAEQRRVPMEPITSPYPALTEALRSGAWERSAQN